MNSFKIIEVTLKNEIAILYSLATACLGTFFPCSLSHTFLENKRKGKRKIKLQQKLKGVWHLTTQTKLTIQQFIGNLTKIARRISSGSSIVPFSSPVSVNVFVLGIFWEHLCDQQEELDQARAKSIGETTIYLHLFK